MKPSPLRRLNADDVTRADLEMARVEQSWREYSPQGWHPVDIRADNPLDVDMVSARSYKVLAGETASVPRWRRVYRWLVSKIYA